MNDVKSTIIQKLFTDEDPFHIHKTMGIYCLLNFMFQLSNYFRYKTMFLPPWVMLPHILLHVTSFVFKVLAKRPVTQDNKIISKMSMFIWEELRLHSLLFGFRSALIVIYPEYSVSIVFTTMALADLVTGVYGIPNITTVRGNNQVEKKSIAKKLYSVFFSTSQMGATIICAGFFQKYISRLLVFCTLPAIQTSAFGMTLLRKNIITKEVWQAVYSLELVLVYIVWYFEYNNLNILWYSLTAYLLRSHNLNKYILWGIFWAVHDHFEQRKLQSFLSYLV